MNNKVFYALFVIAFGSLLTITFTVDPGFFNRTPGLLLLLPVIYVSAAKVMSALTFYGDQNKTLSRYARPMVPTIFALLIVISWESLVIGYEVPFVLLPPPSTILSAFFNNTPTLWADFRQTYLKAVLAGYVIGCTSGFFVAQLAVKSKFLQNGLLPVGNFMSAIPIVGIAPIMVMWFGFDWQSKAAVIVVMTFFPMFINTLTGLKSVDALHKDLFHTYAASKTQTFFKSQFPQALPFIFNALKINSTLALIGAIVAEFFGTPIVGMGFRISTEVGRMNMDMVWATILVAALAGSISYGALALLEKSTLFWHASVRGARSK